LRFGHTLGWEQKTNFQAQEVIGGVSQTENSLFTTDGEGASFCFPLTRSVRLIVPVTFDSVPIPGNVENLRRGKVSKREKRSEHGTHPHGKEGWDESQYHTLEVSNGQY